MPIKFRCMYCGQLLGIARRKAGSVVSCPKCDRSLSVPLENESEKPKPFSAPVFEAMKFDEWISERSGSGPGSAPPFGSGGAEIAPPPEPISTDDPAPYEYQSLLRGRLHVRNGSSVSSGMLFGLIVVLLVITFGLGILVGLYVIPSRLDADAKKTPRLATKIADSEEEFEPALGQEKKAVPQGIKGTIRYSTDNPGGQTKPDEGACILVLPTEEEPAKKIGFLGLRPEDFNLQSRPGVDQLRLLGGQFAHVRANGEFEVELSEPGTYCVLIISQNGRRQGKPDLFDERKYLGRYFEDVEQLLTDHDFLLLHQILVQPGKIETIDYEDF